MRCPWGQHPLLSQSSLEDGQNQFLSSFNTYADLGTILATQVTQIETVSGLAYGEYTMNTSLQVISGFLSGQKGRVFGGTVITWRVKESFLV